MIQGVFSIAINNTTKVFFVIISQKCCGYACIIEIDQGGASQFTMMCDWWSEAWSDSRDYLRHIIR